MGLASRARLELQFHKHWFQRHQTCALVRHLVRWTLPRRRVCVMLRTTLATVIATLALPTHTNHPPETKRVRPVRGRLRSLPCFSQGIRRCTVSVWARTRLAHRVYATRDTIDPRRVFVRFVRPMRTNRVSVMSRRARHVVVLHKS
jgi:hypothetical protein